MGSTLENLRNRGAIERTGTVLAIEVEDVLLASWLVHEGNQLDFAEVEDPEDLLAGILSSGTLLATDSSLLSGGKETEVVLNDLLIERL